MQLRRDTGVNWTAANPILAQGEVGVDTTVQKFKLGTGSISWSSLPYYAGDLSGALLSANRLSELSSQAARAQARTNLDLENIDCGTFN